MITILDKRCDKGYPCGGSCINISYLCHKEFPEGVSISLDRMSTFITEYNDYKKYPNREDPLKDYRDDVMREFARELELSEKAVFHLNAFHRKEITDVRISDFQEGRKALEQMLEGVRKKLQATSPISMEEANEISDRFTISSGIDNLNAREIRKEIRDYYRIIGVRNRAKQVGTTDGNAAYTRPNAEMIWLSRKNSRGEDIFHELAHQIEYENKEIINYTYLAGKRFSQKENAMSPYEGKAGSHYEFRAGDYFSRYSGGITKRAGSYNASEFISVFQGSLTRDSNVRGYDVAGVGYLNGNPTEYVIENLAIIKYMRNKQND